MDTFSDIITAIGGAPGLSEAIGVEDSHARVMKTRGSIPPEYWSRLIEWAKAKSITEITFETLMHARNARGVRHDQNNSALVVNAGEAA